MGPNAASPNAAGSTVSEQIGCAATAAAPAERDTISGPNNPFEHDRRGVMQVHAGALDEAEASFRNAIAGDPTVAGFYLNLGDCLARSRRLDDAILALREAVRLAPDDPGSHTLLGDILLRAVDSATARRRCAVRSHFAMTILVRCIF